MWSTKGAAAVAGEESTLEESWSAMVKENSKKHSGRRPLPWKPKPQPLLAYTIMMSSKYIPALISPVAELIFSMEGSMVHTDAAMKIIQCHDPLLALAIVCGLLADALQDQMVGTVDRDAVNKAM